MYKCKMHNYIFMYYVCYVNYKVKEKGHFSLSAISPQNFQKTIFLYCMGIKNVKNKQLFLKKFDL